MEGNNASYRETESRSQMTFNCQRPQFPIKRNERIKWIRGKDRIFALQYSNHKSRFKTGLNRTSNETIEFAKREYRLLKTYYTLSDREDVRSLILSSKILNRMRSMRNQT